jgi:hypothetical protein
VIGATLLTDDGVLARVTLEGDRYEIDPGSIRKAALADAPMSLRDVGELIATMQGDDSAGSRGSYAKVTLT